jgi:hypothetical protein
MMTGGVSQLVGPVMTGGVNQLVATMAVAMAMAMMMVVTPRGEVNQAQC